MYFYNENPPYDRVYHVHIPRTAGRYIQALLMGNGYYKNDITGNCQFEDKELLHLEREKADRAYLTGPICNDFAVIRNPITRFANVGFMLEELGLPRDTMSQSYDTFVYYMDHYPFKGKEEGSTFFRDLKGFRSLWNSWYEPQINFINNNTSLWLFEKGFNQPYIDWLETSVGVRISNVDVSLPRVKDYDDPSLKIDIQNKQLQNNVLRYYKKDFELWEALQKGRDCA